jgi:hypothetical protein
MLLRDLLKTPVPVRVMGTTLELRATRRKGGVSVYLAMPGEPLRRGTRILGIIDGSTPVADAVSLVNRHGTRPKIEVLP